ncbi:metal/formaldehyde-sensitive transcriptional repressor [Polaromonas sp.]|uniref:metal/formaldehyde-sensitive transcriptional repressor n=1 Tax=Polaromonas sp. TaxID=1869339 RepID=UPI00352A33BD
MAHTITGRKRLLARVRRIQGQASALEKALTDGTECAALLQQIAAIRGATNGLMAEVLDGHLREHVGAEGLSAGERERELDQIAAVLRSYLK